MEWYMTVMRKYADFSGRARRKEYWMFALFNFLFAMVLSILDNVLGLTKMTGSPIGPLYAIYLLAVIIPGFAVTVRRLHDTNRSGWWLLINLIPIIGGIIFLIFMVQDSEPGSNQYGPSPKSLLA